MSFFFISYKHEPADTQFVQELRARLVKENILTWSDSDIAVGSDWQASIDLALDACYGVILVATPKALDSKYVAYEWAYAIGAKKEVIPVVFDGFNVELLHDRLKTIQFIAQTDGMFWEKLLKRLQEIKAQYSRPDYPLAIELAMRDLNDPDPEVRQRGIKALKTNENSVTITALTEALRHDYPDVRLMAAVTLTHKKYDNFPTEAYSILEQALFIKYNLSNEKVVMEYELLGELHDWKPLQQPDHPYQTCVDRIDVTLAFGTVALPHQRKRLLSVLWATAKDDREPLKLRIAAVEIMGKLGHKKELELLETLEKHLQRFPGEGQNKQLLGVVTRIAENLHRSLQFPF